MKVCTRCKEQANEITAKFCRNCGKELENSIRCCNNELGAKDKYCPTCGEMRPKFQSEIEREEWEIKDKEEILKIQKQGNNCCLMSFIILFAIVFFIGWLLDKYL